SFASKPSSGSKSGPIESSNSAAGAARSNPATATSIVASKGSNGGTQAGMSSVGSFSPLTVALSRKRPSLMAPLMSRAKAKLSAEPAPKGVETPTSRASNLPETEDQKGSAARSVAFSPSVSAPIAASDGWATNQARSA